MNKTNFGLEILLHVLKGTIWVVSMFFFIDYYQGNANYVTGGGSGLFLILTYMFTVVEIKDEIRKMKEEFSSHLSK